MILLRPDCLVFKRMGGENVPCSIRQVMLELLGDSAQTMDESYLQNVAEAVLHYFKQDLGWTTVSVGEFAVALSKVLRTFGFEGQVKTTEGPASRVMEGHLDELACQSDAGFELLFFPRLRSELQEILDQYPRVVRFRGLRPCVKQLIRTKRWSPRCQDLSDRIVEYLRQCFTAQAEGGCALVVI